MTMKESVPDDGVDDALALVGRPREDSSRTDSHRARPHSAAESGTGRRGEPESGPHADAEAPTGTGRPHGPTETGLHAETGTRPHAETDTGPHAKTGTERHRATPWPEARSVAARAGAAAAAGRESIRLLLGRALGHVLAEPLCALTDLPSFDTSAMDGWAVAGPGPWRIDPEGSVLAGHGPAAELADGDAVRIATGARVPAGATAVVRSEHSRTDPAGRLHALREVVHGQDIRPRGQECRTGDRLLPAGSLVTPAVLGLAAAAGYDELTVRPRPCVEVLVLGDELLTGGLPREGLIRDALGPMLGPWLHAFGADVLGTRRIGDDAEELHAAVTGSAADLVITTGGTAAGPVDHVHPVLARAGATLLVDGVKVRPGHPMLLARIGEDPARARYLVGLPGNPLAAVSGLLTLAEPLLRALAGNPSPASSPASAPYPASAPSPAPSPAPYPASSLAVAPYPSLAPEPYRVPVRAEIHGHPYDTRLVPVVHRGDQVVPLHYNGPAMLRGIAAADGMAVVPPGGARPGQLLDVLDLPWSAPPAHGAAEGACFT
ncbi:molybdopterin molybdotransferase MoeA [Streptomyces sp. NPDC085481]|uniref:molybdopterin molybdotransferase MoeA n=1 Tax=Streptomyces sp. NPDC085481 TaxID=3365727 RepID=UPI0037D6FE20